MHVSRHRCVCINISKWICIYIYVKITHIITYHVYVHKKKASTSKEFEHGPVFGHETSMEIWHGHVTSSKLQTNNLGWCPCSCSGVLLNGIPGGVQMHQVWGHSCHVTWSKHKVKTKGEVFHKNPQTIERPVNMPNKPQRQSKETSKLKSALEVEQVAN